MTFEDAKNYLADEEKKIDEWGDPPCRTLQEIAFLRYVVENRQKTLTLLEKDAPDFRRQNLILVVTGFLSARDYVLFLNRVCDLIESEKIKITGGLLFQTSFIKEGFLAYNYDQPEVASLNSRLEAIYKVQEPGQWDEYFANVKSGEQKKQVVQDYEYDDRSPEIYKVNSKEAYRALVKGHEKLLADEARKIKGQTQIQPASTERKTVVIREEGTDRVRIVEVDEELQSERVECNRTVWEMVLIISVVCIGGVLLAWRCFRK